MVAPEIEAGSPNVFLDKPPTHAIIRTSVLWNGLEVLLCPAPCIALSIQQPHGPHTIRHGL